MDPKGLHFAALILGLLLTAMTIDQAMADAGDNPPPPNKRPHGPPPEAYAACEGKQAGETVVIVTPRGRSIEAVCVLKENRLVAKPVHSLPPPPGTPQ